MQEGAVQEEAIVGSDMSLLLVPIHLFSGFFVPQFPLPAVSAAILWSYL